MFITAKIAFMFTSLSAVQICDFHIFTAVQFRFVILMFKKKFKEPIVKVQSMACRFSLLFFFFDKTSIKTLEKKKNHTEAQAAQAPAVR